MNKDKKSKLRKILVGLDPDSKPDVLAAELNEKIDELKASIKDPKDYSGNIESLKNAILSVHRNFLDKAKRFVGPEALEALRVELEAKIPVFEKYDDTELKEVIKNHTEQLEDKFKKLRIEAMSRGGAMNRQININSSVMSAKYTDINFIQGSNILLSKTDDDTNKRVNITIAGSVIGGTPGGSNTQVQFNDSGVFAGDSGLTFDKASNVLSAGGLNIATGGTLTFASAGTKNLSISGGTLSFNDNSSAFKIFLTAPDVAGSNKVVTVPDATGTVALTANPTDITVPDEAYGAGWNASLEVPTKNAVYDKMETLSSVFTTAGVYSPTASITANLDASPTMTEAQYMRVGDTVTVSGRFTADPTLTATQTNFEITLPVATNIGAVEDLAGVAFCGTIATMGAELKGSTANDKAVVSWVASDVNSQSWSYTHSYQII